MRIALLVAAILLALAVAGFFLLPQTIRHDLMPVARETAVPTVQKTLWRYNRLLRGEYPKATDAHFVEYYVALNREYWQLEGQLQQESADDIARLEELGMERDRVRPYAEAVVEQQVASIIRKEGLVLSGGRVLPPPRFTFADSYYILVTSPRNEIRIEYTRLLGKDLPLDDRMELERLTELRKPDLAALVFRVGGLAAFYPAQIYHRGSTRRLLDLCVHEWLHQYLFVASPLGRTYLQGGRMRTINETIANMLGREIGDKIYMEYYASPEDREVLGADYVEYLNQLAVRDDGEPQEREEVEFNFSAFMRETYLETILLLEMGDIEGAEVFMDERRQRLVEEGYNIRRINQAYFAFRGTYADSPDAIDRIGPALARWRLKTSSPREYLAPLKGITSYEEFLAFMDERGIAASISRKGKRPEPPASLVSR